MDELIVFEQFRYDNLIHAFNAYLPPSVCKRCINDLDELVSSLVEDLDKERR